jgi:hypothetical protein
VLVAAAVVPHPPLLHPGVGRGLGDTGAELRRRCADAARHVVDARADVVFVVGADTGERATSLAPWAPGSAEAAARLDVPEPLPLPLLLGAWLTVGTVRSFVAVDPDLPAADCAVLGAELAAAAPRVALLVAGDGAARHDEKAPGYVDPRAPRFDADVAAALAAGDAARLAGVDPALAAELLAVGRAPWQVLAGAAAGVPPPRTADAVLLTPYGVGWHVARWGWEPAGPQAG